VSEIEHYERVVPDIQPGISVRGQAVNDVVHLLSELAENATTFSPAESLVHVSGYSLNSGGVLLDITDQGVGMGAEEIAHANWRLDNPPVVDVAVSRRMGLFVVARLAARHGIHVRLRPASKGGLTALVWLPDEVITQAAASLADLHPMGEPSSAGATSWMDTGLAVNGDDAQPAVTWPAADSRPAAGTRPARPVAGRRGYGDVAAEDGAGPDASTVVPAPSPAPPPSANGTRTGTAGLGAAGAGPAPAARHVVLPPAESTGPENRLPIFESVESDWFRRGGQPVSRAAPQPDSAETTAWSSPADAGWQAAEAVRAPVFADTTEAGLPKRVPKANLVPGGAGPAAQAPPVPGRSASQTRQRLSSFQQGIRKARATGPGDETSFGDEADRAS
jgi:hypothetical protein